MSEYRIVVVSPCEHGETRRHAYRCDCPEGNHRYIGCPNLVCVHALGEGMKEFTADGPVILLPDTGDGVKVAKLDDIERLREHTTFIAEDGEVSIRRYRPDEWRYALIDAVRMVAE